MAYRSQLKREYAVIEENERIKIGPPLEWIGSRPPRGCEVYIGNLPIEIFEDELIPLLSRAGKIYELLIMTNHSGGSPGFSFATYSTQVEAWYAINLLNGYEIRPTRRIVVCRSIENRCLYFGNIPKTKSTDDVWAALSTSLPVLAEVFVYKDHFYPYFNRGYAFVEFSSHRIAAQVKKSLVRNGFKLWGLNVHVDWAKRVLDIEEPENRVKALFVRNFDAHTTTGKIQKIFEEVINNKVKDVIKFVDYIIISFYKRAHAIKALATLQDAVIDGGKIKIQWVKPIYGHLYKYSEFNHIEHRDQEEHASSPQVEAIGSTNTGESSVLDFTATNDTSNVPETSLIAPAKLESMCQRYMWGQPIYKYENVNIAPTALWTCSVELPHVRVPLLSVSQAIGPLNSWPCLSAHEAFVQAAEKALLTLRKLGVVEEPPEGPFPAPTPQHPAPGMLN